MKEAIKLFPLFVLVLTICSLTYFSPDIPFQRWSQGRTDWVHHYYMAQGKVDSIMPDTHYAPFWRVFSSPFAFNQRVYKLFILFLFFLVGPFVYYYFTKEKSVLFFYFGIQAPFNMEFQGAFPQFFLCLLFLPFIFTEKRWLKGLILLFSLFVHQWGFPLLAVAWLLQEIYLIGWKNLSLGCTALVGQRIEVANNVNIAKVSIGDILRFFGRNFNVFLLIPAVIGFFSEKKINFLIVLCPILFVLGFVLHARIWNTLSMFLLIGIPYGLKKIKNPLPWYLLAFVLFLWNFVTWYFDTKLALTGEC